MFLVLGTEVLHRVLEGILVKINLITIDEFVMRNCSRKPGPFSKEILFQQNCIIFFLKKGLAKLYHPTTEYQTCPILFNVAINVYSSGPPKPYREENYRFQQKGNKTNIKSECLIY